MIVPPILTVMMIVGPLIVIVMSLRPTRMVAAVAQAILRLLIEVVSRIVPCPVSSSTGGILSVG